MACSNAIVAALSESDRVAVAAHTRMRRLLAAVDVLNGKWSVQALEQIANRQAALFIHDEKKEKCHMQLDNMELVFASNTGAAQLRWLTAIPNQP